MSNTGILFNVCHRNKLDDFLLILMYKWLKCLHIFLIIFPCKLFGPKLLVENILFISKRVYHNFGLRNHWLVESSWISRLKDHICTPKIIQNPWKWPPAKYCSQFLFDILFCCQNEIVAYTSCSWWFLLNSFFCLLLFNLNCDFRMNSPIALVIKFLLLVSGIYLACVLC